MPRIKRALISCFDKTGLERLAKVLVEYGVELIASDGTAKHLMESGLQVKSVEVFAGIREELGGRVKTLHPKIHAAILARRDDPAHVKSVGEEGLIDLVVVNLYPFSATVGKGGVSLSEAIEQIDIGGVALLRAAAKNFQHVAAVSQPSQYDLVIDELRQGNGVISEAVSRRFATDAFALTSRYDTAIADFLTSGGPSSLGDEKINLAIKRLPEKLNFGMRLQQVLRYGENPHQLGAWYVPVTGGKIGLGTLNQLQGKDLSYNNFLDMDAALCCLLDIEEPACVIVKHHSICGLASADTITQAYEYAYACDTESAFGSVVGVNRPVDAKLAQRLAETFLEVIVAPSVEAQAQQILKSKANLRLVAAVFPDGSSSALLCRQLLGGWLLQEPDISVPAPESLKLVTSRSPTDQERQALLFAWRAVKHVKSNGIVIVRSKATVGIGQGQPSRVGSVRLALEKAGKRAKDSAVASDGFFPFPDSIELLAQAGVKAVIQPGGSIRDAEVIEAADRSGMAMLVTGIRHFRH